MLWSICCDEAWPLIYLLAAALKVNFFFTPDHDSACKCVAT